MTTCVNLAENFGDRFRVGWDPAYDPDHVPVSKRDPWMMQMPCERGLVYPFGEGLLAVEVDGRPQAAKALAAIPGVRLHQDGDAEKTFVFASELFDDVAAIVRPRKRRRLTEEQRAAASARLSGFRFLDARQGHGAAQKGVRTGSAGSEPG